MPHATGDDFQLISVTELHPTFGAEVHGVDFSKPVTEDVFAEIHKAITKVRDKRSSFHAARTDACYSPLPTLFLPATASSPQLTQLLPNQYGVLVFRHAQLNDARHVAFASLFGELDDIRPYLALGRKNRFAPHDELFDVSNLEDDGSISQPGTKRDWLGRGNTLFHTDSSFNPRRAGYSLLRAHELPPPGHGGDTQFADMRAAYADLDASTRDTLQERDYVAAHSLWHSRKLAAPGYAPFAEIEPRDYPFGRHRLVQRHEASGRTNLYLASHVHHLEHQMTDGSFEEVPDEEAGPLVKQLMAHASRPENVLSVDWREPGDLVVWDNTCVMHRVGEGTFHGRFVRDMRRCTVHDGSVHAWGLNDRTTKRMGLP